MLEHDEPRGPWQLPGQDGVRLGYRPPEMPVVRPVILNVILNVIPNVILNVILNVIVNRSRLPTNTHGCLCVIDYPTGM